MTIHELDLLLNLSKFLGVNYSWGSGYIYLTDIEDIRAFLLKNADQKIKHYAVDVERNLAYLHLLR